MPYTFNIKTKRTLTICLGCLWLLDGILQLQPQMFTNAFVSTVLVPNLQNPWIIAGIVAFGIRVFSANIVWFNSGAAALQIMIGLLLLLPVREETRRFGLWLSVAWGIVVWVFGEGFGALATGSASFYTGAPGAALLYVIIALALLYSWEDKLPRVAGALFLLGAVLNLVPMFWQPGMLAMLAMVPAVAGPLGALGAQGTMVGNFLAIDALAALGIFLILTPNRAAAWITVIFLVAVWAVSQNFGGLLTFPFGTATDPNAAPLFALFLLPILMREPRPRS